MGSMTNVMLKEKWCGYAEVLKSLTRLLNVPCGGWNRMPEAAECVL